MHVKIITTDAWSDDWSTFIVVHLYFFYFLCHETSSLPENIINYTIFGLNGWIGIVQPKSLVAFKI